MMEEFLVGDLEGAVHEATPKTNAPAPVKAHVVSTTSPKPIPAKSHLPPTWLILSIPVVAILGYQALHRLPGTGVASSHGHSGGFWTGFLISSSIGTLVLATAILKLEQAFDVSRNISFGQAHMAPTYPAAVQVTAAKGVLNPKEYQRFPLVRKDKLSPNVFLFVFKLPNPHSILGLPIGQHVAIRAMVDGKQVSRSYTPVSNNTDKGELRKISVSIKLIVD